MEARGADGMLPTVCHPDEHIWSFSGAGRTFPRALHPMVQKPLMTSAPREIRGLL